MIAKLIAYGENRYESLQKIKRALEEYVIMGIDTNLRMHQKIIKTKEFSSGNYNINFMYDFK